MVFQIETIFCQVVEVMLTLISMLIQKSYFMNWIKLKFPAQLYSQRQTFMTGVHFILG